MLQIRVQSITQWIGTETKYPRQSQFKCGYSVTAHELERELIKAGAKMNSLILQMWVEPHMIRNDGQLRAAHKVNKPGVILSFTRKVGWRKDDKGMVRDVTEDVNFPCDTFSSWQDNLRGIALSLKALRDMTRYGVFKHNELVSRLGLPSADGKMTSRQEAAKIIADLSDGFDARAIETDPTIRKQAYRAAAGKWHPDRENGNHEIFSKLVTANNLLDAH
jgi:hypothetical protein